MWRRRHYVDVENSEAAKSVSRYDYCVFLCSSVPEVFCFRVCPSVSESVRPENSVNTTSQQEAQLPQIARDADDVDFTQFKVIRCCANRRRIIIGLPISTQ